MAWRGAGTWLVVGVALGVAWPGSAAAAKKAGNLAKACDDDDGKACRSLAEELLKGEDIPEKDSRRAIALLERGCTLQDGPACTRLANELRAGLWTKKDLGRAATLDQQGCNLGDVQACTDLGVAYVNGVGVEQSYPKAIPFLKTACKEENPDGCYQLGLLALDGKGGPPDAGRAESLLKKSCKLESGKGCHRLGQMYLTGQAPPAEGAAPGTPDLKKAARYFTSGCDLDCADACVGLGKMRLAGQGMGMDEDAAVELFKKACKLGDAWACVESGAAPEEATVVEALRQQCAEKSDPRACFAAGKAYLKSEEDGRPEKGGVMLGEACEGGVARACYSLGLALEKGEALPRDPGRAQALFTKACKGGYKKACNR